MLFASLQRIFVYDKVIARVPGIGPAPAPVADLPDLLDRSGTAIRDFDPAVGLSETEVTEFEGMLEIVRGAMAERTPRRDAPLRERLAAIASSRYYDQHLVDGLAHWGSLFNPDVADYYRQQALPARNHARMLSTLVAAGGNHTLTAGDVARLDAWYGVVVQAARRIPGDLAGAADMLRGRSRKR
ncbi:hypothetical protein ACIP5Y_23225 [Nocardia sp. NPDC088792]|uniref:hypothetical protein n=1 Tax=Nocardia sp. NPDC088792 TaxID=3364332 RepID=UPI0037FCBC0E